MPRVLVVVAVDAERAALGARCLGSAGVEVAVAGIGRTNAAAATAEALALARAGGRPFGAAVSAGIAGSLPGSGLAPGAVVISERCVYAEEGIELPAGFGDMSTLGFPLGPFRGNSVPVDRTLWAPFAALGPVAPIATVATCSGTDAAARRIRERTHAAAEAMEGAAVVHAALRAGVPGIEVRAISNTTGDRPRQQWDMPRALAALGAVGDAIAALAG
ncbi:MAG: futalosine hydrolase [Planctomycetes bacterium]|nr:futalosine hydrolase [Planctomycetota bacterium]